MIAEMSASERSEDLGIPGGMMIGHQLARGCRPGDVQPAQIGSGEPRNGGISSGAGLAVVTTPALAGLHPVQRRGDGQQSLAAVFVQEGREVAAADTAPRPLSGPNGERRAEG